MIKLKDILNEAKPAVVGNVNAFGPSKVLGKGGKVLGFVPDTPNAIATLIQDYPNVQAIEFKSPFFFDFKTYKSIKKGDKAWKGLMSRGVDKATKTALKKDFQLKESVNEASMPPVRKVVNAILKKHGIVPMKTSATSVKGFHNIDRGGYRYEGNYFLGFYGVPQDIIDKVGAEMKKAGVKDVDVRKGIISADFTKTGLKESINEIKKYKKGDKLKIKLPNGKKFDVVFVDYSRTKGIAYGKFKDGGEVSTKPFSLSSIVESVNEATTSWFKMMQGVRKGGSGPWSLVGIENNKVIAQKINIKDKNLLPAHFEAMRKEHPRAKIHIEDAGGQVVWNEKR